MEKFFRDRGKGEVADWLKLLGEHVNEVGVPKAMLELEGEKTGKGEAVQYAGWAEVSDFCRDYLERNGVTLVAGGQYEPDKKLISSASEVTGTREFNLGITSRGKEGDVIPPPQTLKSKLEEAQKLPGLEKSEDLSKLLGREFGGKVPNFSGEVLNKLDETYGKGKWIVKSYGAEAYAGYGIFFPQRVAQLTQEARNLIWESGQKLAQYGFKHLRDESNKIVGIYHTDGKQYRFGSEEYNNIINGDARYWSDIIRNERQVPDPSNNKMISVGSPIESEGGASIPEGRFMAQPAFPVIGVTEEERAKGVTFKKGQEGRVHISTRNGKAEIIPHSTWLKLESLPVVFENDDTLAMAKAAVDAINALPESERQGQLYAPDIVKTADGYRVVEANPSDETGSSGYLQDNPLIMDAYVSHLTGRDPAHVRFIRDLLTEKKKPSLSNKNLRRHVRKDKGGPCKPGETSAKTGCIPATGSGGKKPASSQQSLGDSPPNLLNRNDPLAWIDLPEDQLEEPEPKPEPHRADQPALPGIEHYDEPVTPEAPSGAVHGSTEAHLDLKRWLSVTFPKMEKMVEEQKTFTTPNPTQSWDDIDEDTQSETQNQWENDHYDEYAEDAEKEWRRDLERDISSQVEEDEDFANDTLKKFCENHDIDFEASRKAFDTNPFDGSDPVLDESKLVFLEEETEPSILGVPVKVSPAKRWLGLLRSWRKFKDKAIVDETESRVESEMENGLPDSYREGVYEALSDAWNSLSDDEKFQEAGIDATKEEEVSAPEHYEPMDPENSSQEDYNATRGVALFLQKERTLQLLEERKLSRVDVDALSDRVWGAWKSSSTSDVGLALQDATATELNGDTRLTDQQKTHMEEGYLSIGNMVRQHLSLEEQDKIDNDNLKAAGGSTLTEIAQKNGVERVLGVKDGKLQVAIGGVESSISLPIEVSYLRMKQTKELGRKILRAYVRATWEATQFVLHKAGMDKVEVYRGLMLARDFIDKEGGETEVFDKNHLSKGTWLSKLHLDRNGAASATPDPKVANGWLGVGNLPPNAQRVVMRAIVPGEAVLSIPVYGQNIHHEQEVVIAGLGLNEIDFWKDRAPHFNRMPIKNPPALKSVARTLHPKSNVINLNELEEGQPHWLSKPTSEKPGKKPRQKGFREIKRTVRKEQGAPCKRGETAAKDGCIPAQKPTPSGKDSGPANRLSDPATPTQTTSLSTTSSHSGESPEKPKTAAAMTPRSTELPSGMETTSSGKQVPKSSPLCPVEVTEAVEKIAQELGGVKNRKGCGDLVDKLGALHTDKMLKIVDDMPKGQRPTILVHAGNKEKGIPTIWLLGWSTSEGTDIHDHVESQAGIRVLRGEISETVFLCAEGGRECDAVEKSKTGGVQVRTHTHEIRAGGTMTIPAPYTHEVYGTHPFEDKEGQKRDVTVHAYFPPLEQMNYFTRKGDKIFWDGTWDEATGPAPRLSPQEINGLVLRAKEGGFTYDAVHHQSPTKGYVVSTYPEYEKVLSPDDINSVNIQHYFDHRADVFDKDPEAMLGGWYDPESGKIILDVVKVVDSEQEAVKLGARYKQAAVWDLEHGKAIAVDSSAQERFKGRRVWAGAQKAGAVRIPSRHASRGGGKKPQGDGGKARQAKSAGAPCKPGERADLTHCVPIHPLSASPSSGTGGGTASRPTPAAPSPSPAPFGKLSERELLHNPTNGLPTPDKIPPLPEPPVVASFGVKKWIERLKDHPYLKRAAYLQKLQQQYEGDTESRYNKGGVWDENRVKTVHQKVMDHFLNPKAKPRVGDRPQYVLIIGTPGAGKTSVGMKRVKELMEEYTLINPDEIRQFIPEYTGWNATLVHEECAYLARRIEEEATKAGHNIIYDGSGRSPNRMLHRCERVSKNGYDVHVVHVALPAAKATYRAAQRFLANPFNVFSDDPEHYGRYTPPEFVFEVCGSGPNKTYQHLRHSPYVTTAVSYNNDVPRGAEPELIDKVDNTVVKGHPAAIRKEVTDVHQPRTSETTGRLRGILGPGAGASGGPPNRLTGGAAGPRPGEAPQNVKRGLAAPGVRGDRPSLAGEPEGNRGSGTTGKQLPSQSPSGKAATAAKTQAGQRRSQAPALMKKSRGSPCKVGERADTTGCIPHVGSTSPPNRLTSRERGKPSHATIRQSEVSTYQESGFADDSTGLKTQPKLKPVVLPTAFGGFRSPTTSNTPGVPYAAEGSSRVQDYLNAHPSKKVFLEEGRYPNDHGGTDPVYRFILKDTDRGRWEFAGEWMSEEEASHFAFEYLQDVVRQNAWGEPHPKEETISSADEDLPEGDDRRDDDEDPDEENPDEEEVDENDTDFEGPPRHVRRFFGKLTKDDISSLLGMKKLKGDVFIADYTPQEYEPSYDGESKIPAWYVKAKIQLPEVQEGVRYIAVDENGEKFIKNEYLSVKRGQRGGGLGTKLTLAEATAASKAGFSYILTHAAGSIGSSMNGYYTWPRLGFNETLQQIANEDPDLGQELLWRFPKAVDILDVLSTKEGVEWWKENGSDLYSAKFDLKKGSKSWKALARYLVEKKKEEEQSQKEKSHARRSESLTRGGSYPRQLLTQGPGKLGIDPRGGRGAGGTVQRGAGSFRGRAKAGGATCQPGERSDLTGCIPAMNEPASGTGASGSPQNRLQPPKKPAPHVEGHTPTERAASATGDVLAMFLRDYGGAELIKDLGVISNQLTHAVSKTVVKSCQAINWGAKVAKEISGLAEDVKFRVEAEIAFGLQQIGDHWQNMLHKLSGSHKHSEHLREAGWECVRDTCQEYLLAGHTLAFVGGKTVDDNESAHMTPAKIAGETMMAAAIYGCQKVSSWLCKHLKKLLPAAASAVSMVAYTGLKALSEHTGGIPGLFSMAVGGGMEAKEAGGNLQEEARKEDWSEEVDATVNFLKDTYKSLGVEAPSDLKTQVRNSFMTHLAIRLTKPGHSLVGKSN